VSDGINSSGLQPRKRCGSHNPGENNVFSSSQSSGIVSVKRTSLKGKLPTVIIRKRVTVGGHTIIMLTLVEQKSGSRYFLHGGNEPLATRLQIYSNSLPIHLRNFRVPLELSWIPPNSP
jgi:hypothetical protein